MIYSYKKSLYKRPNRHYSTEYCAFLEAAYGEHMLSEGGSIAIDNMFQGIALSSKKLLDIGSGLGGAAFHLAKKHQATVTGIEINPLMIQAAQKRIPLNLKALVNFTCYSPPALPFQSNTFDVIYSKGVLTHIKNKIPLFKEIFRTLKTGGCFIIDDWLSPTAGQWGKRLNKMCDLENLMLYADTENNYKTLLKSTGFSHIQMRDENNNYYGYKMDIVKYINYSAASDRVCFLI